MTAVCSHLPALNANPRVAMHNTAPRRPVPFPLPKKLGSDRLLLVSQALHETPTYKSISPELQQQRNLLKRSNHDDQPRKRRVHFRAVDRVHQYEKDYDESDYANLWFNGHEQGFIFERDDEDFKDCFSSMPHTKRILQLWGMCSRQTSGGNEEAVDALNREAPHPHARGLEQRIIAGIRNHRQKAVQSFLQMQSDDVICPRYLKFSQTAGRFAQAMAQGDARIAELIQDEPEGLDEKDDWGY